MNYYIYFTIAGLAMLFILSSIYFIKPRVSNDENKIYTKLIIITVVGCLIELSMIYTCRYADVHPILNAVAAKGFLIITELWITILTYYTIVISSVDSAISKKFKSIIVFTAYLVGCVATIMLKIEYFYPEGSNLYIYTYGPATKAVFVVGLFMILFNIFCVINDYTKFRSKKYFPVYVYIVLSTFVSFLQQAIPEATLISFVETLIVLLMYFTIENPDVRLMELENK